MQRQMRKSLDDSFEHIHIFWCLASAAALSLSGGTNTAAELVKNNVRGLTEISFPVTSYYTTNVQGTVQPTR